MVASMVKGWLSLPTPEALKKITSSTRFGVDKKYTFYPGCDRGYWTLKPPALIVNKHLY
jgi:hypothetical protein